MYKISFLIALFKKYLTPSMRDKIPGELH